MLLTRLAVGLEPLNTLDAAHRSPRSVALERDRNWFPRKIDNWPIHLAKQRTDENVRVGNIDVKQSRKSLPATERTIDIHRQ
jgi:hypothetical protein